MFFWIIGVTVARKEVQYGSRRCLGKWFEPMTRYVYIFLTILVLIGGILLGGIG